MTIIDSLILDIDCLVKVSFLQPKAYVLILLV